MDTSLRARFSQASGNACLLVMLLSLLPPFVTLAQGQASEAALESAADEIDEFEPGVDTATFDPAIEPAASDAEVAAMDPAVPSAVLAEDVTRSQSGSQVMDRMELGHTAITGNQELPKVLYIVPWKKADPGDLMGKPVNTLLDEVLAPLDREEFVRSVDYYGELNGVEEE